jgi:hypothetical protein
MVTGKGLDALNEARAFLTAAAGAFPTAAGGDKPEKERKVVDSGMPIVAPEYKPPIEVKTVGQAVAQAIAEDPIASRLPAAQQRDLAHAIYEQLRKS